MLRIGLVTGATKGHLLTHPLELTIGDTCIRVRAETDVPLSVSPWTRKFARKLSPSSSVDVTLTVERAPHGEQAERGLGPPRLASTVFDSAGVWTCARDGGRFIFDFRSPLFGAAPYKVLEIDEAFTHGRVRLAPRAFLPDGTVDALEYPLDELLLVHHLATRGGVVVHACAVRDESGRGYLFVGHSGAGKSTSAGLWSAHGATVLADDRVIVRFRGDVPYAFGTPWVGTGGFGTADATPIDAVFVLRHAAENCARSLSPAAAVAELVARAFVPHHDAASLQGALTLLGRLAAARPVSELSFVPDARVVKWIRARD